MFNGLSYNQSLVHCRQKHFLKKKQKKISHEFTEYFFFYNSLNETG